MFKKIVLFILILSLNSFAKDMINVYSIQILSSKKVDDVKKEFNKVSKFPFARVEKVGKYYVLRIGNANSVKKLKPLLKKIKKSYKSAFIRVADILSKRIILSNFQNSKSLKIIKNSKHQNNLKDIFSLIPDTKFKAKKVKKIPKRQKVEIQPYAALSIKLNEVDKDGIKRILNKHMHTLPYRDEVFAEDRIGDVNDALYQAYKNMKNNSNDYLAYKQFKDLYEKYANRFQTKIGYENFDNVSRLYTQMELKKFIGNNSYLYLNSSNYFTSSYKKNSYKYLPTTDTLFSFGFKKIFDSENFFIEIGLRKSLETFPTLLTKYNFKTNKYWNSAISLGVNQRADESNYLFYGGTKSDLKYSSEVMINSKNIISSSISINKYYSQNYNNIGSGLYFESRYLHKYRVGYPDFSSYATLSGGFYNENSIKKGSINRILLTPNTKVLPENFIETCFGFLFGLDYTNSYKKILRPYLNTSFCYNTAYKGIGYSIDAGIGGGMFNNDNLSLGISLGRGFLANPYTIFNLMLFYRMWF